MTRMNALLAGSFLLLPLLAACDGQQYVDPDTVALTITKTSTSKTLVSHCNYVPVLLGSEVQATYPVEGDLAVELTITRDSIRVAFTGGASSVDPFVVSADDVKMASQTAASPPSGYAVVLTGACKPDP